MTKAASRDVDLPPPPRESDAVGAPARPRLARMVAGAPELVAVAVAGFSLGPMILLLTGAFTAPVAVPLGLLGAAVAMWVCGLPDQAASRRTLWYTAGAAVVTLGWFLYNVRYYAQDVYATRDPATYGLAARWLMDHNSLDINSDPQVFGSIPHTDGGTAGFRPVAPGVLHIQGNHLLPGLASLAGSVFGSTALFQANVAIGAIGLFIFFGLTRRIVGEPLALLAMTTLAVSMPFLYVSRDAYSEPLMLVFLMGGLALLHRAIESGRLADFALAGFVAGCSAMVRVDSYGALLAMIIAAIAVAAVAHAGDRRWAALRAAAVIGGIAVPLLVGWVDLTQFSRQYYGEVRRYIVPQLVALFALSIAAPVIAWLGWRPAVRMRLADAGTRRRIARAAAVLLVAFFAVLASRPLWLQTHLATVNPNLEHMQASSGVAVDGTRSYNEQTVNWLAMYLGWPTVLLAVTGYVVLVTALLRRQMYALVGTVAMGLIMSGIYLWNCQITPDQVWAMRRYIPVVMPLLLVAAAAALRALWWWQRPGKWGRLLAMVAGVLMVAVPLSVTQPMVHVRDEAGQLTQLEAICAAVGRDGAVVEVDHSARDGYGQAIRSYCGVPTTALPNVSASQLASLRATVAAHGRTLFVLSQDPTETQYATSGDVGPFSSVTVERWPTIVGQAPTAPSFSTTIVFLSTVDAAGLAHPVPPAR